MDEGGGGGEGGTRTACSVATDQSQVKWYRSNNDPDQPAASLLDLLATLKTPSLSEPLSLESPAGTSSPPRLTRFNSIKLVSFCRPLARLVAPVGPRELLPCQCQCTSKWCIISKEHWEGGGGC